jgi:hypothetical protein
MTATTTRIEDAANTAAEALNATAESVGRATERVRGEFGDADRRVRELVETYPLTCFLGAVATGYLLGRIARRI